MFAKVFASLWDGSMIGDADAQLVFVFLLAHADSDGVVDVTHEKVVALTGVPLDRVREAVGRLEAPDPRSRTPEEGGRRLMRLADTRDWGWLVVNYAKYRAFRDAEGRREYQRELMRKRRERTGTPVGPVLPFVDVLGGTGGPEGSNGQPRAGAAFQRASSSEAAAWEREFSEYFWPKYRRKDGRAAALKVWMKLPRTQATLDTVVPGLVRWNRANADTERKFTPLPATWLNNKRWEDEVVNG